MSSGSGNATHMGTGIFKRLGVTVQRLASDSRKVQAGDTFLAYPGETLDGRKFIGQAIASGANSVLWESEDFAWNREWQVPNLGIKGLRDKIGDLASYLYGQPSQKLWVIGVTGTNGKTSCSHWIAQCLTRLGKKTAVVGTLGNGFLGALEPTLNATPDAVLLQAQMAKFVEQGAQCVAMEVSSHSLVQGRVNGVDFDIALFTNLSRDHLDYHGNMQAYAAAKARLFHWPSLQYAIINMDDRFGMELAAGLQQSPVTVLGYGLGKGEISGHLLNLSKHGLTLEIVTSWGTATLQSSMLGAFNASNLLGVLATLLASEAPLADAVTVLGQVQAVRGRLEVLSEKGKPTVVIDYAHTPDALEKVLQALREILNAGSGAKIFCVFGCGGDRDRGKRALMGEVASRLADLPIVTSDNPRGEAPRAIIEQILSGMQPNYRVVEDRAAAIYRAIAEANERDVVLVAGKGHETYQEINGVKLPFSDVEVAKNALRQKI
ncbi:MAG TPA: UDP-N-acetylmuramoyl-L-alanyl-D-glutamate--2,6-diaminopimelate ligase [Burkholderiales bacterium]|nr:UDP-N-acetylmuramoyl-L-alanyl-D-glutamate--2,6-diaminopimelate ligase [Burkholderiales bacterium]